MVAMNAPNEGAPPFPEVSLPHSRSPHPAARPPAALHGPGEVPVPPPGFEQIQVEVLSGVFGRAARVRLGGLPVAAVIIVTVSALGPSPWRVWFLASALTALTAYAVVELARFRLAGGRIGASTLAANMAVMSVAQLALIFSTGGLESPMIPVVLPFGMVSAVVIGRRPGLLWVTVPQVLAIWTFTLGALGGWLPDVNLPALGGGLRAGHNDAHLWTSALLLTFFLGVATSVGLALRSLFDTMLARALVARAEELASHRDHAAELTALSAEIAHELKNPLATIKGLSTLLERDATGRSAERLAVLRGEVDRMQATLEEFLTFSRPLVPLAVTGLDLAGLCHEVAALHEGVARGRGVTLAVTGAGLAVGDRRKLRQILINLVQNALEASPVGGAVQLVVRDGHVEVLDRGAGPPADLGDQVFAPGVTTKPTGNGLGLTIARALARQHGGDLRLAPREGGGCRATLSVAPTALERTEPSATPGDAHPPDSGSSALAAPAAPARTRADTPAPHTPTPHPPK